MIKLKIINIWQSVVILGLLVIIIGLLLISTQETDETIPASLETPEPKSEMIDSETKPPEMIYETTGEKILLRDSAYGEIWIPVLADVPACTYQHDQFVTRNHLTYYLENDKIVSKFGIDVSAHQEEIDWQTVKAAGVDFAMIRAGYRGYSGGTIVKDDYFERNIAGAQAAGIDIGVYFYSQAITVEEAIEEAEATLTFLGDTKLTYPVVFDWEIVTTDSARTDNVSVKTLTDCSIAFCERIKQAGYIPMVYQNKRTSLLKLDLPELTDYDFWLAEYNEPATYYYNYQMWQFASDGTVPGVSGNVDVNVCFKDYTVKESDET